MATDLTRAAAPQTVDLSGLPEADARYVRNLVDALRRERADQSAPNGTVPPLGLADLSAREAGRDLARDAADAGMAVDEYLAFLANLDARPLHTPGLSPAGSVDVTFVPAGRVRPLPLPDDGPA